MTGKDADSPVVLAGLIKKREIDRVLSTISPTPVGAPTVETLRCRRGVLLKFPLLGLRKFRVDTSAVWDGLFTQFNKVFVAQRTPDLGDHLKYIEVGFDVPTVDRERAIATKASLGIAAKAPGFGITEVHIQRQEVSSEIS